MQRELSSYTHLVTVALCDVNRIHAVGVCHCCAAVVLEEKGENAPLRALAALVKSGTTSDVLLRIFVPPLHVGERTHGLHVANEGCVEDVLRSERLYYESTRHLQLRQRKSGHGSSSRGAGGGEDVVGVV
jgi:hypothetical protein